MLFFSVAECQEDGCPWHNWPWGAWDVPHRGSGDWSLCQSYDDSQSGLGFTSNLLNWLKNSCCCCCCFFFSVNFFEDPVAEIHQHHCKEYRKIYKLAKLEKWCVSNEQWHSCKVAKSYGCLCMYSGKHKLVPHHSGLCRIL